MENGKDEVLSPNELEYPIEYFDAQVQFAKKWSLLSGVSLSDALLRFTALYRRINGTKLREGEDLNPNWIRTLKTIEDQPDQATNLLFTEYSHQSHAQYKPANNTRGDEKHFGFFGFDYYPNSPLDNGKNVIKVHFNNTKRGQRSGLHPDFRSQRRADLRRMFEHIQKTHGDATEVVGGSWLYHLGGYRENFPEEYLHNAKRLVPIGFEDDFPDSVTPMSFNGDSLWGQFVNRNGHVRQPAYDQFVTALASAVSLKDMIVAFLEYPLQPRCEIGIFYNHLGIETK